jgi:hypothetical protein
VLKIPKGCEPVVTAPSERTEEGILRTTKFLRCRHDSTADDVPAFRRVHLELLWPQTKTRRDLPCPPAQWCESRAWLQHLTAVEPNEEPMISSSFCERRRQATRHEVAGSWHSPGTECYRDCVSAVISMMDATPARGYPSPRWNSSRPRKPPGPVGRGKHKPPQTVE